MYPVGVEESLPAQESRVPISSGACGGNGGVLGCDARGRALIEVIELHRAVPACYTKAAALRREGQ